MYEILDNFIKRLRDSKELDEWYLSDFTNKL